MTEDQKAIDALIEEAKAACKKHQWYVYRLSAADAMKSIRKRLGFKFPRKAWSKREGQVFDDELRITLKVINKPFFATESQAKAFELNGLLEAYEEEKKLSIAISISRILGQLEQLPKVQENLTEPQRIALIAKLNAGKFIPLEFVSFAIYGKHSDNSSTWNKRIWRANGDLEEVGLAISLHMVSKRKKMWYMEVQHLQPNSRDRIEPKKHTIVIEMPESLD